MNAILPRTFGAQVCNRAQLHCLRRIRVQAISNAPAEELQCSIVADALRKNKLAFGFSAGGLLFPYYIGVVEQLEDLGVLSERTPLAGSSAGSLIAACYHSGLTAKTVTEACLVLADDCRVNGTRGRLGEVLSTFLHDLLPEDAHERCRNKTFVAVTKAWPRPQGQIISEFESREDLIESLLTSCHIPWWFAGSLGRNFRGSLHYDGGLTSFIPSIQGCLTQKVTCFPAGRLNKAVNIAISPPEQFDLNQLLGWAFRPAEEPILLGFLEQGRKDALAWAEESGVLEAVPVQQNQTS
ncbi:g1247 [Coccomyxa viridis]|uniref:Patatin n=1 Tax=Coccomyxa viridis TaxID=1274662 RepID=A0ABP1FMU7_9CHLO